MAQGFKWFGKDVLAKIEQQEERALDKTAIAIINTAKKSMTEAKHGKGVPPGQGSRGGRKPQKRTRSAKDEPPAVQTGKLRGSLAKEKPRKGLRLVGTNLPYGRYLETGTSRIAARPYLRPALEKNKKKFEQFMKGTVK